MRKISYLSLLASAAIVAPAAAQTFHYTTNPTVDAAEVTSYQTNFNDLDGMVVTAYFGGSTTTSCTGTWGYLGSGISGVACTSGNNYFSIGGLSATDTYFAPWGLVGSDLIGFNINAVPGDAVFDIVGNEQVTDGSSVGQRFDYNCAGVYPLCLVGGSDYWGTSVTYSDPTTINGVLTAPTHMPPITDIWGQMSVSFSHTFDAGGPNGLSCLFAAFDHASGCNYAQFYQDMDNVSGNQFGTPEDVTPEPASMSLMAMGLVGMMGAGYRRRRRNG